MAMPENEFVNSLVAELDDLFGQLGESEILEVETGGQPDVATLLKIALQSELEASDLAGYWLPGTRELEAKMLFAEQCGDEMKHYRMIAERLDALGEDLSGFDALAEGYSPLYHYQHGLRTTIERVASGVFASEAIAKVRNQQFAAFCRAVGDEETARLYNEIIGPEEVHHYEMGREYLARHATTAEDQELAAAATRNTLAIAEELSSLIERSTGLKHIPIS